MALEILQQRPIIFRFAISGIGFVYWYAVSAIALVMITPSSEPTEFNISLSVGLTYITRRETDQRTGKKPGGRGHKQKKILRF